MRRRPLLILGLILAAGLASPGGAAADDPDIVLSLDLEGELAPGAEVVVTIETTGEDGFVALLQCEVGSDNCESRGFVEIAASTGSDVVVVRRYLQSALARVDCAVVPCEIRARGTGRTGSLPISVDGSVVISRPILALNPSDGIVDRDSVEISGTGFEPFSIVQFFQCTLVSCSEWSAVGETSAGGEISLPPLLPVTRLVDGIDCAPRSCFVLGVVSGNADAMTGALLAFDPDAPLSPPASVSVEPAVDLLDQESLTVAGASFVPGEYVSISSCVLGDGAQEDDCVTGAHQVVDDSGQFEVTVSALRRIGLVDCGHTTCGLVVRGRLDTVSLSVEFDTSVAPPAVPALTVVPTLGLVDHQAVIATIENLDESDYISPAQCVVDTDECRSSGAFRAGAESISFPVQVSRDIGETDCALVPCEIAVVVHSQGSVTLSVALDFAVEAPRADPPSLRVLPASGLWDGQLVETRVANVLTGDTWAVGLCGPEAPSPADCGEVIYSFDDQTALEVRASLELETGATLDCRAAACEFVLFEGSGGRLDAVAAQFAGPALPTSSYPAQLECVAWPTESWPVGELPDGVDEDELHRRIDAMLATGTSSVLVIHGGTIVAERFDPGYDESTVHHSQSLSKTFVGTVIGMLVDRGLLDPDGPAPVSEWSEPDDPRHAITVRQMMNMASGLDWDTSRVSGIQIDTLRMLLAEDSAAFVAEKPLVSEPGETFEYSTGTTQVLARMVSELLDAYGSELEEELDALIFDVLGIDETLGLDATDVWYGGTATDMSTRDFARLGLLHLRGGVWEDEQLVAREWIEFMHEPSPAYAGYAGQIWRRGGFVEMVGLYGQKVTVRPDLDLVVVSNAVDRGSGASTAGVVELFESVAPASCSDEPVLVGDSASTVASVSVSVDVLANDPGRGSALRPDTLSVYDVPVHGSAEVVGGEVVYTPETGFTGMDEFSYLVCTEAPYCGTASITVTVESWGMSLRHADAVVMGSVLQLRVRATDAPEGASLEPVDAHAVEIDCAAGDVVGQPASVDYVVTHPSGLTYVRWTTDDEWDGCRRLVLTFGDGSALGADVTMLVPIP